MLINYEYLEKLLIFHEKMIKMNAVSVSTRNNRVLIYYNHRRYV